VAVTSFGSMTTATLYLTAPLAVGSHTITAAYYGDWYFSPSSTTLAGGQTVVAGSTSTSTAVASSLNPSTFNQSVTFTATVSADSSDTPSGTVEFYDGSTSIGQGTLNTSENGLTTATFSTSSLAVGTHTVTARYDGDAEFALSSGSVAGGQTVNNWHLVETTTTIARSV